MQNWSWKNILVPAPSDAFHTHKTVKKALSLEDQVDLLPEVARKCIMVFSEHRSIK